MAMADREWPLIGGRRSGETVQELPLEVVVPNPYQPRRHFDDEALQELARTIRLYGVVEPVIARKVGDVYELVAGERRYRAAALAGLTHIPAVVRELSDAEAASLALIENLQREGLSPIEEAQAYRHLMELQGLTQEALAQRLGKSQSTVANKLRLLHLPPVVQEAINARLLTERHARALLALPDGKQQVELMDKVLAHNWTVKETEQYVQKMVQANASAAPRKRGPRRVVAKDMRLALNTIHQAVTLIRKSGVDVEWEETEENGSFEIRLRLTRQTAKSSPGN
ncbi:MAG: nucleoid occlusion protein [Firmicutes bacterium]|nr:nucleoid occlusion protein [Bacillota bacterium]